MNFLFPKSPLISLNKYQYQLISQLPFNHLIQKKKSKNAFSITKIHFISRIHIL